jgi:hypothetical protein
MTQSLSNREQCTRPGKLVLYRRLAGKAHEKRLVEVHAASCPATSVVRYSKDAITSALMGSAEDNTPGIRTSGLLPQVW